MSQRLPGEVEQDDSGGDGDQREPSSERPVWSKVDVSVTVNHEQPEAPVLMKITYDEGRSFDLELTAATADRLGITLSNAAGEVLRRPLSNVCRNIRPDQQQPGCVRFEFFTSDDPDRWFAFSSPAMTAVALSQEIELAALAASEPMGKA